MTLSEACEVLAGAAWTRETPLVALLDEIVEWYDAPLKDRQTGKQYPGKITRAFADYKRSHARLQGCGQVSSGRVVQLLISLRQQNGMPLYAVES